MTDETWNDERTRALVQLWGEGLSVTTIAKHFGDVSDAAVRQKALRMGLAVNRVLPPSPWTDESVAKLRALWAEGLTASQIAKSIGGLTRNSVISKLHRIGLTRNDKNTASLRGRIRAKSERRSKLIKSQSKPKVDKRSASRIALDAIFAAAEPFTPTAEEVVIPLDDRRTIATLEKNDCRWPIGDPRKPDFHFCGRSKVDGLPYCETHALRAYQTTAPRQRVAKSPTFAQDGQIDVGAGNGAAGANASQREKERV